MGICSGRATPPQFSKLEEGKRPTWDCIFTVDGHPSTVVEATRPQLTSGHIGTGISLAWGTWTIFALYLLLMPFYASVLNKYFAQTSCFIPTWELMRASRIRCVDGRNLTQLAIQAGRLNAFGEPSVCGCAQGIFGEDICPLGFLGRPETSGRTISGYTQTPTGTATFAIFSSGPVAMMWLYGTGAKDTMDWIGLEDWPRFRTYSRVTLAIFQISLWVYLASPGCILFDAHVAATAAMILVAEAHFLAVAAVGLYRRCYTPALVVFIFGVVLFVPPEVAFIRRSSAYISCNVLPGGSGVVAPGCEGLLQDPTTGYYYEALGIVSIMAVPVALVTASRFK